MERDKIDTHFQKYKQAVLSDPDKNFEGTEEAIKIKNKKSKKDWNDKRDREEKSFVDANDYIGKLNAWKVPHPLIFVGSQIPKRSIGPRAKYESRASRHSQ